MSTEGEREAAVLEQGVRLAESSLWKFQRRFYDDRGVRAWSDRVVPTHITSNAFMADAYARVIMRVLQDCASQGSDGAMSLDPSEPVHVIELGAGSGYFAHLVLSKLIDLQKRVTFAAPRVCYVATDFTRSNVEQWKQHPCLRPLADYGLFDAARFDAESDEEIELELSGRTLAPGRVANPVIVIANYVFDTLHHDVFRVRGSALEEGMATLRCEPETDDPADANELLDRLRVDFEYRPLVGRAYDDPVMEAVVREYAEELGDTALPFPTGAMACVRNLERLAGGRLVILSADKGYTRLSDLAGQGDPHIVHHGSISMMVNYHALGRYVEEAQDGFMMATTDRAASLEIALISTATADALPETRSAFHEAIDRAGPLDIYQITGGTLQDPTLEQLLAVMRASRYDPMTFMGITKQLQPRVTDLTASALLRVRHALHEVWKLYFPLPDHRAVPFELGFVHYVMGQWAEALYYYQQSIHFCGEHPVTFYNMGLCQYRLGQPAEALRLFERSLALDPSYGPARDWRLHAMDELADPPVLPPTAPSADEADTDRSSDEPKKAARRRRPPGTTH